MYDVILKDLTLGKINWLSKVKQMLQRNGFLYIWENPNLVNHKHFVHIFKQRLVDEFSQTWTSNLASNSILSYLYIHIKSEFRRENYLNTVTFRKYRNYFTKLRTSSHNLRIETGRHGRVRVPRNERVCIHCNLQTIDDEYHFIIECLCHQF